jgi:hypothetical protein
VTAFQIKIIKYYKTQDLIKGLSFCLPVMLAIGDGELGATLQAELGLHPRRLLVQNIEQLEHELLGGHGVIEYRNAIVVVRADRRAELDQTTTQVAIAVLIGEQERFSLNKNF